MLRHLSHWCSPPTLVRTSHADAHLSSWRILHSPLHPLSRYVYTPYCGGGDCVNYGWPDGYTFVVQDGAALELVVSVALDATQPKCAHHPTGCGCRPFRWLSPLPLMAAPTLGRRHDLFVLEYSEPQLPDTQITLSVAGDPLIAGGVCSISSRHDRHRAVSLLSPRRFPHGLPVVSP